MSRKAKLFFVLLLWMIGSPRSHATSVARLPWRQLVSNADFVGVVECTDAGIVVARYRVVESWKGEAAGTTIAIKTPAEYWHAPRPVSLVGERFVVAASRSSRAPNSGLATVGNPDPLLWRRVPHDYALPLLTGSARLPLIDRSLEMLGSSHSTLEAFRTDARAFLALDAATRERPIPAPNNSSPVDPVKPTQAEIARHRVLLQNGGPDHAVLDAVAALSSEDPELVAAWLVGWENPLKRAPDDRGYLLASAFARRCGKDRVSHFTTLLDAKDPYVQVAGAVYLAIEDEAAGTKALLSRSSLPGDPGAWAALVRASRGDKSALPRMLEVFDGARRAILHDALQARAQVLLSNSAAKSGLPLPFQGEYPFPEAVKSWWQLHGSRVVPYDPWLAILDEQRRD